MVGQTRDELMARAAFSDIGLAVADQVGDAAIEPKRDFADFADDEVVVLESSEPHNDINASVREVTLILGQRLDLNVAVQHV